MSDMLQTSMNWLQASPLHRMSLGSRELFHTNFLAWLFEQYPSSLSVFGVDDPGPWDIRREYKHVDIAVCPKGTHTPHLVIENKVKDVTNINQLDRYGQETFPDAGRRVILSLAPINAAPESWEPILYSDLAIYLSKWMDDQQVTDARDRFFIKEYIELIRHLGFVTRHYFDAGRIRPRFWFGGSEDHDSLREIGFHNTFRKHQAQVFARDIAAQLEHHFKVVFSDKDKAEGKHVLVWTALFNSWPCVTFVPRMSKDRSALRLEVQIQANQYRRIFVHDDLRGPLQNRSSRKETGGLQESVEELEGYDWLFGREKQDGCFDLQNAAGGAKRVRSSMASSLGTYRPDVVYQYLNIDAGEDSSCLTVSELPGQIVRDLELAFECLERML